MLSVQQVEAPQAKKKVSDVIATRSAAGGALDVDLFKAYAFDYRPSLLFAFTLACLIWPIFAFFSALLIPVWRPELHHSCSHFHINSCFCGWTSGPLDTSGEFPLITGANVTYQSSSMQSKPAETGSVISWWDGSHGTGGSCVVKLTGEETRRQTTAPVRAGVICVFLYM